MATKNIKNLFIAFVCLLKFCIIFWVSTRIFGSSSHKTYRLMVLLKSCCMILYNTLLNVLLFNFDFFFSHKGYTRTLYPEWRINLLLQVMSVPLETVFERMTSQMVVYWNNAGFALYNDELTLYPFVIPTLPPNICIFIFISIICFYISKILLFFKVPKLFFLFDFLNEFLFQIHYVFWCVSQYIELLVVFF